MFARIARACRRFFHRGTQVTTEQWTFPRGSQVVAVLPLPDGSVHRNHADGTWSKLGPDGSEVWTYDPAERQHD